MSCTLLQNFNHSFYILLQESFDVKAIRRTKDTKLSNTLGRTDTTLEQISSKATSLVNVKFFK